MLQSSWVKMGAVYEGLKIAGVIPCHNEEVSVGRVIEGLRSAVPGIDVYVYDNASSDRTRDVAHANGAIVRTELRKGKGNVVRRAFADIDADVYVMIDGDDTYDAASAPLLIETLLQGFTVVLPAADHPPARSRSGQRGVQHGGERAVRYSGRGHVLRLSRVLQAVREVLPRAVARVRDRG